MHVIDSIIKRQKRNLNYEWEKYTLIMLRKHNSEILPIIYDKKNNIDKITNSVGLFYLWTYKLFNRFIFIIKLTIGVIGYACECVCVC